MSADGRVLGSGRSGGSNWESAGLDGAVNAIAGAVDAALEEAGAHARPDVAVSVFALAGVDWPVDHVRLPHALGLLGLGGRAASSRTTPSPPCAPGRRGRPAASPRPARARSRRAATSAGRDGAHDGAGLRRARRRRRHRRARDLGLRTHARALRPRRRRSRTRSAPRSPCATSISLFESITRSGLAVGAELAPLVLDVAAARGDAVAVALLEEQGRSLADEVLGVARRLRHARRRRSSS